MAKAKQSVSATLGSLDLEHSSAKDGKAHDLASVPADVKQSRVQASRVHGQRNLHAAVHQSSTEPAEAQPGHVSAADAAQIGKHSGKPAIAGQGAPECDEMDLSHADPHSSGPAAVRIKSQEVAPLWSQPDKGRGAAEVASDRQSDEGTAGGALLP